MRTAPLVASGIVLGLLLWLFLPGLVGGKLFAFRDVAHFYHPLFAFVQQSWNAGEIPLWDPLENLGQPLAGNPTASVFYPIKGLFFLPIGYDRAYILYLALHWLLAVAGVFALARAWQASTPAATTAAIAYGMSGAVLFTVTNVVFLVGAAWFPLAWLAGDRMLRRHRLHAAVGLGIVLGLMTLGGDPQAAYHAVLWIAGYGVWTWWDRHGGRLRTFFGNLTRSPDVLRDGGLMGLAAAVGIALAAVQIVPSLQWASQSDRAVSTVPRSIYEVPGHLGRPNAGRTIADGLLFRKIEPNSHYEHVYHFSVGPWRLAEMVWPNFSGRQFPEHRRWLDAIPAEGRVWTPSLYLGLLPLLMAVAGLRFRGGSPRQNWLSWFAVLTIVGCFGWFGLGWLIEEMRLAMTGEPAGAPAIGAPVGGVYWLMTLLLPGYVQFRYPAKLLVPATLALCLLAAQGFDRTFAGRLPADSVRRLRSILPRSLLALVGVTALVALTVGLTGELWRNWLAEVPPNVLFGPLDVAGARVDLLGGLLHTTLLGSLLWGVLVWADRRPDWAAIVALVLTAGELLLANSWLLPRVPAALWHAPSTMAAAITGYLDQVVAETETSLPEQPVPPRILRRPTWLPEAWSETRSADRLAEAVAWDRNTLWPKYPLTLGLASARVAGTMMSADYRAFLQSLDRLDELSAADLLGADWIVAPQVTSQPNKLLPEASAVALPVPPLEARLWRVRSPRPRAWIAHRFDVLAPLESADPAVLARRTAEVLFDGGQPRDLYRRPVVETDLACNFADEAHLAIDPGESCRIVRYRSNRVELDVELNRPGLVVLAEQFAPGWHLRAQAPGQEPMELGILRTNRVMRGAWLPAGRYLLTYEYRPMAFTVGAVVSVTSWLTLLVLGGLTLLRRGRRSTPLVESGL